MASASTRHDGHSYYGRPIVKAPVWKPLHRRVHVRRRPSGWLVAARAGRAALRQRPARPERLALAAASLGSSPPLLIADLGRPARFLNMLRVFKVTSPMSVGTWVLSASGATRCGVCRVRGRRRRAAPASGAETTSALLAPTLCTYTAVLVADTAVPVWHEARRELPFVFAGGAAMSAGAAASLVTRHADARAARRLLGLGVATELAATAVMDRRLGPLAQPYREGQAGLYMRAAKALTIGGAALTLSAGRRRVGPARVGSVLVLVGAACTRLAVLAAGTQSANDPQATVEPQRRRADVR